MITRRTLIRISMGWTVAALPLLVGCNEDDERNSRTAATEKPDPSSDSAFGPGSSAVKPMLDQGWCGGHGVPESVCTRCNTSLIPRFKAAGDWCDEHGLPESQCTACRPGVANEWARLDPDNTTKPIAGSSPLARERKT
ncbi:MAG: hypothetical protein PVI86_13240, partial [Phycisphaerae bacterium]